MSSAVNAAPQGSPWGKEYFPNTELTDQSGKKIHFYDDLIKDKIVLINFIFTECVDSCSAETANLRKVQKILADRMGKDIFFYSISIDPKRDTPEALTEYAKKFRIDTSSGWSFLTGDKNDIIKLRKSLGLYRAEGKENKLSEHTTSIMTGNESTGQWVKRSPFDDPNLLAHQLGRVLSSFSAYHNSSLKSYDTTKKIPNAINGEDLFRHKCLSCHDSSDDNLGPDLTNIIKTRDLQWLKDWIKAPDEMIKKKDPLALQLFENYKILMPNLKMDDSQINSIIDYLTTRGKLIEKVK